MSQDILKLLNYRNQFLTHLETDIDKIDKVIDETVKDCDKLEQTIEAIETLKIYPEHEAFIPLSKNIFVKGKIVHTGEYYVKKVAHPDSYACLQTVEQTLDSLKEQVQIKKDEIEKAKYSKYQLKERKELLTGKDNLTTISEDDDEEEEEDSVTLEKEIYSDKGVAVKVGDFYEIFEHEN